MVDPALKAHPDYSDGYFDALGGHSQVLTTPEYVAGWEAGQRAQALFASQGMVQTGPSTFSTTLTTRPKA